MEKQGRANRIRTRRGGLLKNARFTVFLGVLFFFFVFTGTAGEGESELGISVISSPENPVIGGSWAVTILVEHPVPSEVSIRPPRFPPSLSLERVRSESRLLTRPGRIDETGPPLDPARWTAIEFLFTILAPGEIVLGPFGASAGGKSAVTREISVRVRENTPRRSLPVFRWEAPASLTVGEAAELRLILINWDPGKKAPRDFLKGKAPLNAILDEFPPAGPLPGGEFVYPLSIIPLEEGGILLEPFSFQWEGVSLKAPALSIQAKPNAAPSPVPALVPASALISPEPEPGNIPFPETGGRVFPFFKAEYEQTVLEAKALWEQGRRAPALAKIRGKERESWAGPGLAVLRRKMEQSLGLFPAEDETWRPRNMGLVLFLGLLFIVIAAKVFLSRFRFFAVTLGKTGGYKIKIILAAAAIAVIFFVQLPGSGDRGRAVLEKTAVYRVPEKEGTVSALFGEGQLVHAGAFRGEWVYVESAGGEAGWAPAASVIKY
jgi:hypothetical protein